MIKQIDQQIEGNSCHNLNDQISSINRGVRYYEYCAENYKVIYEQPAGHKMSYYYRALEVQQALRLAFGGEAIEKDDDVSQYFDSDDYTYRVDSDFVQKCADMIIEHMKPIMENLDEMEKNFLKL